MKAVLKALKPTQALLLAMALYIALAHISDGRVWAYQKSAENATNATISADHPTASQEGRDPEANLPFFFSVFAVTWAGFFVYVFVMSRRQRDMQREIEELSNALREKEKESEEG